MEMLVGFTSLDRNTAPERLSPGVMRVLQRVNTVVRPGSVYRDAGCAGTQISPSTSTVTAAGVIRRQDGKLIAIDANTAGTIRITPGDGSDPNKGPLPEWNDSATTEDP